MTNVTLTTNEASRLIQMVSVRQGEVANMVKLFEESGNKDHFDLQTSFKQHLKELRNLYEKLLMAALQEASTDGEA